MRRLALALLLPAVLAGLALAAVAGAQVSKPAAKKPIIIGAAIAKTGFIVAYDQPALNSAELAVAAINAKGGIDGYPLKIVYADTKSDINQGTSAALEVINKGATVVIVTCDYDFGGAAARAAQSKGLLALSTCAGSPKFGVQGIGPLAFTFGTGTPEMASAMAEWAYKAKKWRKAYVLEDSTIEYTRTLSNYFQRRWNEQAGVSLQKDTFQQSDPSIATQISRIRQAKPDFIWLSSYNPGGAAAIKQIRGAGLDTPILTGDSMDGSYWVNAIPNLSNFYVDSYASIYGDDPRPAVNKVVADFKARFKSSLPSSQGLTGYALIESLHQAIEIVRTKSGVVSLQGARLAAALETFRGSASIIGATTFTKTLHINIHRPVSIMQIQNGKPSFVTQFNPARVPPVQFR